MIKKIFIKKYKTFENTEIDFTEGLNVIIGPNGVGKTNLLNAIREGLANSNKEIEVLLDGEEVPLILDSPKRLPNGKQVIIVTNNDKFIEKADRILGISFKNEKSTVVSLKGESESNNKSKADSIQILEKLKKLQREYGRMIPIELLARELDSSISLGKFRKIIDKLSANGEVNIRLERYISICKKTKITKDLIEADSCDCLIKHKGTDEQPSRIFCDKIEYWHDIDKNDKRFGFAFDHHLMFWKNGDLVFKVWLPNEENDKEFKNIFEAMKSCGISCLVRESDED